MLDREGNILSYQYNNCGKNIKFRKFDAKYKEYIDNIIKEVKFPPLPYEYDCDKIIMRFYFGFDTSFSDSSYSQSYNTNGSGVVTLEKNSSPLFTLPICIICLIRLPVGICLTLVSIPIGLINEDAQFNFLKNYWDVVHE